MSEKLLPCPFCGGEARTFEYDGANQATCGGKHIDCAGTDVVAPVAMWNRRTPAPEGEACPTCNGVCPEFCSNAFHLASPVVPAPEGEAWTARHIVFDGPPDHNGPRFIEVETPEGKSVNAGEWRQRPDNLWELVIASPVVPVGVSEVDLSSILETGYVDHQHGAAAPGDRLFVFMAKRILAALRPTDTGANHD